MNRMQSPLLYEHRMHAPASPPPTQQHRQTGHSPFAFRRRRDRLNWRLLSSVSVPAILSSTDTATLQEVMDTVTFSAVDADPDITVADLIKVVQLAQLIIEYLLHCQTVLEEGEQDALHGMDEILEKVNKLEGDRDRDLMELHATRKECKTLKKTVFAYQVMFKVPGANSGRTMQLGIPGGLGAIETQGCPYCPKVFTSMPYLDSHLMRRHPSLPNPLRAEKQDPPEPERTHDDDAPVPGVSSPTQPLEDHIKLLTDRLTQTESAIRADLTAQLEQALRDRDSEVNQARGDMELEVAALRQAVMSELDEERRALAAERDAVERLREEVAREKTAMSGMVRRGSMGASALGHLESDVEDNHAPKEDSDSEVADHDFSNDAPAPAPQVNVAQAPPPLDVADLLGQLELRHAEQLRQIQAQVAGEIANVQAAVAESQDASRRVGAEVSASVTDRLEKLQLLLMNRGSTNSRSPAPGLSKATSVSAQHLYQQETFDRPAPVSREMPVSRSYPPTDFEEDEECEYIAPPPIERPPDTPKRSKQPKTSRAAPPPPIVTSNRDLTANDVDYDDNSMADSDWPVISRHLRTHKHTSLAYAPWVKSAFQHLPALVIQMRETVKADLRRALAAHEVTPEVLQDEARLSELVERFESEKDALNARDGSFAPCYDCVWDEVDEIVAAQFRVHRRPTRSPTKTGRFAPGSASANAAAANSNPNAGWRRAGGIGGSPMSPGRSPSGIRSVLRSGSVGNNSSGMTPGGSYRPIKWPRGGDDDDSDDSDGDSDADSPRTPAAMAAARGMAKMARSAIRGAFGPVGPSASASARTPTKARGLNTSIGGSPFGGSFHAGSASPGGYGAAAAAARQHVRPSHSSPLKRSHMFGAPVTESPISEASEHSLSDSPRSLPAARAIAPPSHTASPSVRNRSVGFKDDGPAETHAPGPETNGKSSSQQLGRASSSDGARGSKDALARSSGSRMIHEKLGGFVDVSADEGESEVSGIATQHQEPAYVAAPSTARPNSAFQPKRMPEAQEPGNSTADTSGIGELLQALDGDAPGDDARDPVAGDARAAAVAAPAMPAAKVIATAAAAAGPNFSEWDMESM
ncbi:Iguana/Dzip1-like DAZ-interacting protein N-terminal-domain-containing protein [Blastocladiella britannica]|nr:Iguana/Dzip1-like DAZ-interacting protein N-terminal-domain-containing protein [Blastocladiella britannica]